VGEAADRVQHVLRGARAVADEEDRVRVTVDDYAAAGREVLDALPRAAREQPYAHGAASRSLASSYLTGLRGESNEIFDAR
jgi:hypothetical protein